jgi:hypothetical protein
MNQVVPSSINPYYAKKMHPNQYSQIQIPNYATRDIRASTGCSIVNVFFCFFFGLAAIMFSCKANENANAGRLEEAQSNAKKAKILNIIGICLGSVALLAIIIYYIVSSTKSTSSSSYSYYDYSYYD